MKKVCLLFSIMLITGAFLKAQTVDVTFQVDMSIEIAKENFNPATNQVELRGSFDDWGAGLVLSDDNNDSVYIVTVASQPQNTVISYKFFHTGNDGSWESDPNREVNTETSATLDLDPYFFNDRTPYTGVESTVTFNVNMSLPARGDFDPTSDNVYVAGNFTDWGTGAIEMEDPDGDSTYSVDINLTSGQILVYKYIYSAGAAGDGNWESPEGDDVFGGDRNRIYGVTDGENTVTRFWNNTDPNVTTADGNILFQIDMSVFEEIGIYDPAEDSVRIYGGFNGWNETGDPSTWRMNPDLLVPSTWTINLPFEQQVVNSENLYKFFLKLDPEKEAAWGDGWERPTSTGGGNRGVIFEGDPNQEEPLLYYDDIQPDWVISEGTNLSVNFRVDMQPAVAANEFDPAVHSVYWIPEQPSFAYSQGWIEEPENDGIKTDSLRAVPMTDPDEDMIYEGTLDVTAPSFNCFVYRYRFVDASGTWSSGETDGGPGAPFGYRVRFIGQDDERSFPVNPWTMPLDTWQDSAPKTDLETDPYTSLVGVKDVDIPAMTYELEQNFPNPFNPATIIRFSIPEHGLVTLKVYNILGEEITTLFYGELKSGTYDVDFNASSLSSGVYFYTVTANNFIATKKMILMK